MRAQFTALVSALVASVAAHPTAPEVTARQATPSKLPVLSFSSSFGIKDWQSPYNPGPNGYIQYTARWDVFANTEYVPGLPGFAATCSGTFNNNNPLVGAWTLCSGFPGNATIEGQLIGPDGGFLTSVRHNVTQNGKTTVVIASGRGGASQFELTVQSVETTG
ncbi:hypothetical protein NUW58_g8674 [Xylaria curta]|uniref:Uncharacterized protein n=1 Tax=Xylaria curta TaxID=42375 RepID=A0ACC1N5W6_9PEZI|nr:hypothetical protein NUW58_g8674 [Xylaria curta]